MAKMDAGQWWGWLQALEQTGHIRNLRDLRENPFLLECNGVTLVYGSAADFMFEEKKPLTGEYENVAIKLLSDPKESMGPYWSLVTRIFKALHNTTLRIY